MHLICKYKKRPCTILLARSTWPTNWRSPLLSSTCASWKMVLHLPTLMAASLLLGYTCSDLIHWLLDLVDYRLCGFLSSLKMQTTRHAYMKNLQTHQLLHCRPGLYSQWWICASHAITNTYVSTTTAVCCWVYSCAVEIHLPAFNGWRQTYIQGHSINIREWRTHICVDGGNIYS